MYIFLLLIVDQLGTYINQIKTLRGRDFKLCGRLMRVSSVSLFNYVHRINTFNLKFIVFFGTLSYLKWILISFFFVVWNVTRSFFSSSSTSSTTLVSSIAIFFLLHDNDPMSWLSMVMGNIVDLLAHWYIDGNYNIVEFGI